MREPREVHERALTLPVVRFPRRVCLLLCGLLIVGCNSSSVSAAEIDLIVDVLQLGPGSVVADVGAGSGEWAIQLAHHVGGEGRVWATEVDEDEIEDIEDRVLDSFLNNITVVLGDESSSGLPASCCEAILLRLVYHHFTRPEEMRASLRQALRPDGLLAVVDITPQGAWRDLPGVPDRGGHGIPPADLIREMAADGFEVVTRRDNWNGDEDRYCVVFQR